MHCNEKLPKVIMDTINSEESKSHLQEQINQKPITDQAYMVVLGNTERDIFFYHFLLCSLLAHCEVMPRILLLLDDLKNPGNHLNSLPAHYQWYLSQVSSLVDESFQQHKKNPFFYRIIGLLLLEKLDIKASHLFVSDNDILIKFDLNKLYSQNVVCKYNDYDDSDALIRWMLRNHSDIDEGFLKNLKGAYGDFFFALSNTENNRNILKRICQEKLPQQIPVSSYYYWWTNWLRVVNAIERHKTIELLADVSDSRLYRNETEPVLFHVGGGYENYKIGTFITELLRHDKILEHSPIEKRLLKELIGSLKFVANPELPFGTYLIQRMREREGKS